MKELRAELAQIQKDHDARCHNCHVGYEPIPTSPRLLLLFLDVVERAIRHDDTTQGRDHLADEFRP